MKRTTRRLVLDKQTVRTLAGADLGAVRGGNAYEYGCDGPSRHDVTCTETSGRPMACTSRP